MNLSFFALPIQKTGINRITCIALTALFFAGCSTTPSYPTLPTASASTSSNTISLRSTWSARLPGSAAVVPAINGSTLYIANNSGQLQALDLRSGDLQWSQALNTPLQGTLSANVEYLITHSTNG